MNARFSSSSPMTRVLSVLVAAVIMATLFTAVSLGLTGEDGWSLFAATASETALA